MLDAKEVAGAIAEGVPAHAGEAAQPPGAHGASQDFEGPVMSHGPGGVSVEAAVTAL